MNFIPAVLIFVAHIILTLLLKKIKNNIASGIDLVYPGTFVAGYFLGWEWGAIFGVLFRLVNHLVPMEFDIGMIVSFPVAALTGIFAACIGFLGLPLVPLGMAGLLVYIGVYFSSRILVFGDTNYVMMVFEFLGNVLMTFIIFKYFF